MTKKLEKFIAYLKPAIDPAAIIEVAKCRGMHKSCDVLGTYRKAISNEELFVQLASRKDSPFYSEKTLRWADEHWQNNRKEEAIKLWIWGLAGALSDVNLTNLIPRMNGWQIAKSIASYVVVAGLLFGIMILTSGVPGAKIALEALR